MEDFRDKVAVVTGAASGIGRGMAERFAAEGMKIVLADVEEPALQSAGAAMRGAGAKVIAIRTDVSRQADVEALADRAYDAFGEVHIICNNAGVGPPAGLIWERTVEDWQWVLGVNLWGVIHGTRTFVPRMIAQGTEGHIVNTASLAGLGASPFIGIYTVAKFGVVALSETLYLELVMSGSKLRVSVLCPGWVNTRLMDSKRNRPAELENPEEASAIGSDDVEQMIRQLLATGLSTESIAEAVVSAIREERLYILTHPENNDGLKTRWANILEGKNPEFQGFT